MIIQHNIMALNAHRQLGGNNALVQKNLEKLSSGFRINRAGDDAAGLAISEKMRAQITGLDRAKMNAQDGISLVQTAEGALTETHSMLNRLVELATQSANGTIQDSDRLKVQDEVVALQSEITRIAQSTKFNGISLLDGKLGGGTISEKAGVAGLNGTFTFTAVAADKAASGLDGLVLAGFGNGAVTITAAQVAAKGSSATGPFNGRTGAKIESSVGGIAINGKTVKVVAGAANGLAIGADGNITVTVDKTQFDTEAKFKTAFEAAIVGTPSGGTAAEKLAVAGLSYTAGTAGATWTDKTGLTDGVELGTFTLGGGAVDSTKITVEGINGEKAERTVADSTITNGSKLTLSNGDGSITAELSIADATKLAAAAGLAQTTIGSIAGATATTQGVTTVKANEVKEGNTFTFKIGGADVVFEMIKAGGAVKTTGATGIVATASNDPAADTTANLAALKTAYDAATAAAPTAADEPTMAVTADGFTLTAKAGTAAAPAVTLGGGGLVMQVGDTADLFNKVTVSVEDMTAKGLKIDAINLGIQNGSSDAIQTIKDAIETVSANRSKLGSLQNRLEHTINNLAVTSENMTAAESRIRDVDMAKEMMQFTKNNVLSQAAQAMLAQANQQPQQVLQLLR